MDLGVGLGTCLKVSFQKFTDLLSARSSRVFPADLHSIQVNWGCADSLAILESSLHMCTVNRDLWSTHLALLWLSQLQDLLVKFRMS